MAFLIPGNRLVLFFVASWLLVRSEDAGIIGTGQKTMHQRCGLGFSGKTWA